MLNKKAQHTLMLKSKFLRDSAILNITNSSLETVIFNPKEMLGILDLVSVGYYRLCMAFCSKTLVNILDLNQQVYFMNSLINLLIH